jgi:hypothetical protein
MDSTRSQGPSGEPVGIGSGMVFEARLVHAETGRRVVEVSAWRRRECLGRRLGEAEEAEAAEDRALARLQAFLANQPAQAPMPSRPAPRLVASTSASTSASTQPASSDAALPGPPVIEPEAGLPTNGAALESPAEPDDWSEELAEVDVQLQRLGWDRNLEGRYLERAFGHPSRSRLTAYADLLGYLKVLRSLPQGSTPEQAAVPLRRRDLLIQCDALIARLGWDAAQGRMLLEREFGQSSRQQLSDEDLLKFNMVLETEWMNQPHSSAPVTP